MADPKILRRIDDLLRLAAPASGTTDHERASAALEAARLVAEHELTFLDSESVRERARRETSVRHGVWVLTIILQHCSCEACHTNISPQDHAWVRIVNGSARFRHNYGDCRPGER